MNIVSNFNRRLRLIYSVLEHQNFSFWNQIKMNHVCFAYKVSGSMQCLAMLISESGYFLLLMLSIIEITLSDEILDINQYQPTYVDMSFVLHVLYTVGDFTWNLIRVKSRVAFLPYSQSYPHDLPRMTSLSSTGVGWQATRPVSRIKRLWRYRQTRRNGNVARLDSSNFPTFTSKKYLFGTYRRKIIYIYCPLVTEKSTNPRVKLTCPCLGKPRHGQS